MRRSQWWLLCVTALAALTCARAREPLSPEKTVSDSSPGSPEPRVEQTSGRVEANGIMIAYRIHGPPDREVVLMIPGVGGEMSAGPDRLVEEVVRRGYRVIVYDSRDSGQSTHFDAAGAPDWAAIQEAVKAGRPAPIPYTLEDMARDAIGLLDALGVRAAHIVGGSLGGMVAQIIAAEYPERTRSLTSIMSTTGNPDLPAGSAAQVAEDLQRGPDADRIARQGAAAAFGGDRRARLKSIQAPTVVLHGAEDPLFPVEHGKDTAAAIPGAELRIIPGLGHSVPDAFVPVVVDAIVAAASRARQPSKP